jgi:hypothetical protein
MPRGVYLGKLGEPMTAIVFITTAPPKSVEWLTRAAASKVDLGFEAVDPTAFKEATVPAKETEVKMPREEIKSMPAAAGPNLLPREETQTFIYGPKLVTVRGIGWHVHGGPSIHESHGHMQCIAEQYTDPARDFTVFGRDFSDPRIGTFILIRNVSWEANLPMKKIDVKWASWTPDAVQGVGILDARFDDDLLMPNIDPKEFDRMMSRPVTRVEFAVPADVLPPGNEPKLWVKGFGPEISKALKECYQAMEAAAPAKTEVAPPAAEEIKTASGPAVVAPVANSDQKHDRLQLSVPTWGMGLTPTGELYRPDKPIKPAPLSKTVPGGEIKIETKSLGTVRLRGPELEPPALTQEIVTNAISKRDKLKVSGPYIVHQNDNDVMLEVKP